MLYDQYKRNINYLRISVTDRCNLRCTYCMPEEGIQLIPHNKVLSFEEIIEFTKVAVSRGVNKIRITGGEPLVRKGIINLVNMISHIPGIKDLGMTTNGILLEKFAADLKAAGLMRINVSLDTTDPDNYCRITRGGNIQDVINGILAAKSAGLTPVKINCVIKNKTDEPDALLVKEFCRFNELECRFIDEMNMEKGSFGVVHGGSGGDCSSCNRLRLTSDGFLKPCLFNNVAVNIRETDYNEAIDTALGVKPEKGCTSTAHKFYNIGG